MKLYEYSKRVMAMPMDHKKAEEYLGEKIPNLFYGTEGYIVQELGENTKKWVPKNMFEKGAVLIDTEEDRARRCIKTLNDIRDRLREYQHVDKSSRNKKGKIFTCHKHLDLCAKLLTKLLEIR